MGDASLVALAFRYPVEDGLEVLRASVPLIEDSAVAKPMGEFVAAIGRLSRSEWEELHTETLDLSPKFVPYVGHAVWGENYRRGAFMADLMREMRDHGVDLFGELPDHIDPVLRYVDEVDRPLEDTIEVLPVALMRMRKELKKADKRSPYRKALEAAQAAAEEMIEMRRKAVT